MSPTLALPAAKLALGLAGGIASGIASKLDPATVAKARKQADDFESVFLEQMTERLFATSAAGGSEGPLGENGTGGDIFRSQLTQQYAQQLQKSGGIGLSDHIMRDLLRLQEQSGAPNVGA